MQEQLEAFLQLVGGIPVEMIYLLVGVGAAVENLFPPVPSDVVVVAGGMLADRGILRSELVFLVAWVSNLLLALGVYLAARRFGGGIFSTRWGRWLLRPAQLERMSLFYEDYGALTILVSRFFPVFRVLVPAFAGISRLGFWRTAVPLAAASAAWYAVLVAGGILASRNIPRIVGALTAENTTAGTVALLVAVGLAWLWVRSRRHDEEHD
ncbi:MAG: VTT domain-containing protein [marine benthic group bacterium]|nr:VTT domain-containing protein [Candidatus Benthicola marisminoris]